MNRAIFIIRRVAIAGLITASSLFYFPRYLLAEDGTAAVPLPTPESRLTLELQKVDILDVFKILSKKAGMNIVAGKGVQGQVSIFLQNVPVAEALKTILESQGLASVSENDVIKVMTDTEYVQKYGRPYGDARISKTVHLKHVPVESVASKLNELRSSSGKIISEAASNSIYITDMPSIVEEMEALIGEIDHPLEIAVFKFKHAKVDDVESKLKVFIEGSSGKIEIDKRSNRMVMQDIPSNIQRMREVTEALDVQMPQILIEAKIVEVKLNDHYRRGIDWEHVEHEMGGFQTIKAAIPLAVAPPIGAAALSSLALGSSTDDTQVILNFLEKVGKINILSSPRLAVLNGEEAKLAVATRQPFVSQTVIQTTNSTNTADNVQFIDVGVTLKVAPRVSENHFIIMKIKPEISSSSGTVELEGAADGSNTTFTRSRIPVVTTQELETTVQVQSGTTLVIGGLIQDRQEKNSSKVPGIGSLPLIGKLFQSSANDFEKTELVMFLTPRILEPDVNTQEEKPFLAANHKMLPFDQFGGYAYQTEWKDFKNVTNLGRSPYWERVNLPTGEQGEQGEKP